MVYFGTSRKQRKRDYIFISLENAIIATPGGSSNTL
jgi:hypothetical protein